MGNITVSLRSQIAGRIRRARVKKRLSLREVAFRLREFGIDVSDNTLRNYEKGNYMPQVDLLFGLCEVLGVPMKFLTNGGKHRAEK